MKPKRYSLKGGIIAVTIHVVLSLCILLVIGLHPIDNQDLKALYFPNIFLGLPVMYFMSGTSFYNIFGYWSILYWLAVYWFVLGAIIGGIYGKIKNRKTNATRN